MKNKFSLRIIFFTIIFFVAVGKGNALIIDTLGMPIEGNSWLNTFGVRADDAYNKIEIFIINDSGTSSVDFENPPVKNFRNYATETPINSWNASLINPDYALLTGPILNSILISGEIFAWDAVFTDPFASQAFELDYLFYSGASYTGARFHFAGNNFFDAGSWTDGFAYDRTPAPIPEPATMFLLGGGLLGIGMFSRKFKK